MMSILFLDTRLCVHSVDAGDARVVAVHTKHGPQTKPGVGAEQLEEEARHVMSRGHLHSGGEAMLIEAARAMLTSTL